MEKGGNLGWGGGEIGQLGQAVPRPGINSLGVSSRLILVQTSRLLFLFGERVGGAMKVEGGKISTMDGLWYFSFMLVSLRLATF